MVLQYFVSPLKDRNQEVKVAKHPGNWRLDANQRGRVILPRQTSHPHVSLSAATGSIIGLWVVDETEGGGDNHSGIIIEKITEGNSVRHTASFVRIDLEGSSASASGTFEIEDDLVRLAR